MPIIKPCNIFCRSIITMSFIIYDGIIKLRLKVVIVIFRYIINFCRKPNIVSFNLLDYSTKVDRVTFMVLSLQ